MYVPDSLHDLTGRISDFLKHNVRILTVKSKGNVNTLDQRFRQVPTFGNGTIRRFKDAVSNFTKFAGRDYQDALECGMPCFEGLFSEDLDDIVQDLLFTFATYERYCNLRQHTDSTISTMKATTSELGRQLRRYKKAVSPIPTRETNHERTARLKRDPQGDQTLRRKNFSLVNYKTHALGHHADAIMMYGTTDGTSTQAGEREHRRNKNKAEGQIGALVLVERRLATRGDVPLDALPDEEMPQADASVHHQFPINENDPLKLHDVHRNSTGDPALMDFKSKLHRHLISRILNVQPDQVPDDDLYRLCFVGGRFYRHHRFRLHYTTYDCRRKKESIGYRRSPHIMLLTGSPDDPHPYLYARVIGVYHANVLYVGGDRAHGEMRRMDFLYVRWMTFDESHEWGWKAKRLPRVRFLEADDPQAFGFVDPAQVIRSSHMIPAFEYNTTIDLLPVNSLARKYEEFYEGNYVKEEEDWRFFYVNMFPDTDMFMRYRGGGIGHIEFHEFLRRLEEEATANDAPLPVYDDNGDRIPVDAVGEDDMIEDEDEDEDKDVDEETLEEMFNRGMAPLLDDDADDDSGEDSGSDFD
ncbi:hypothetical protein PQX77_015024 [Marasmius sp. AFHP31]|nr:hypothetical protein PQX77_015024 [Marasmius sp. AFHP31]